MSGGSVLFCQADDFCPPKVRKKAKKALKDPFLCAGSPMMAAPVDVESPR
jgi:hypothetical protein